MKARISSGCRMRAGLRGSVDWRRATWPLGSVLASRQEPPLGLLQGRVQPSGPRSAAGMPLWMSCMSVLLAGVAEDPGGLGGGGGLGAEPVEGLGVGGDLVWFVEVERGGQVLAVDDVGEPGGGEAQQVDHAVH